MRKQKYVALLEHDKRSGKFGVVVPDIPGFSTVGDTYEDALKNAAEGLASHIEIMVEYGERIPAPRTIEKIRSEWSEWESWRNETGGELVADITVLSVKCDKIENNARGSSYLPKGLGGVANILRGSKKRALAYG